MHSLRSFDGATAFLGRAGEWLLRHEDRNNLVLSLAYVRAAGGVEEESDALFATVERHGKVLGCVVRTPPHKVLLTELPSDAVEVVVDALAGRYDAIPATLGPEGVAEAVAREWVARRGGSWRPGMRQRVYRLDAVVPPSAVEGRLRLADGGDLETAVAWGHGFARDSGVAFAPQRADVARWIERGALYLWEVEGKPACIAVASGRTPRGVRVGFVYTPDELRRRGYASACVAALSQRLLDDGYDFCVLYTDLGNPTSNAIYTRIGYEAIMDVRDIDIVAPESGHATGDR